MNNTHNMNDVATLYVVATSTNYSVRSRSKVFGRGTLSRELSGVLDRGQLASEVQLNFGLLKMPVALQVIRGGKAHVKPLVPTLPTVPPSGPTAS